MMVRVLTSYSIPSIFLCLCLCLCLSLFLFLFLFNSITVPCERFDAQHCNAKRTADGGKNHTHALELVFPEPNYANYGHAAALRREVRANLRSSKRSDTTATPRYLQFIPLSS
jgi:hypothetical protein